MVTEAKEKLKNIIDELPEDEATRLLEKLQPSGTNILEFDEMKEDYDKIVNRFEEAFQQLAQ